MTASRGDLGAFAFDTDVAYFKAFTARGGGAVVEADGVLSWESVHPLPFLVNSVVRTDPNVDPAAVIATADQRFPGSYEVLCLVGRDDDLLNHAAAIGAEVGDGDELQVLLDPDALGAVNPPDGIEIRTIVDAAGVADIAAVNRDATALYDMPDDLFPTVFQRLETVLADDIDAVVAYDTRHGDAPVATAQVFHVDGAGYVGWVATARAAMRQGLGTLVTHAVIALARDRGADVITLQASPMGAAVYRRMGFVDVGRVRGATRRRTDAQ